MNTFSKLFGISKNEIKKDVIITPFLNLDYFKSDKDNKRSKGFLFEVINEDYFSVIKTGVGAPFVGDAVLYLEGSACERLYFLGSCGAVTDLEIGDLVVINKALNLESFTYILNKSLNADFVNIDNNLLNNLYSYYRSIKKAAIASVGSLCLQSSIKDYLVKSNIDVVDMESSAFFSASNKLGLDSLAILYITDIIQDKLFCRDLAKKESDIIKDSRRKAVSLICQFIQKQNA